MCGHCRSCQAALTGDWSFHRARARRYGPFRHPVAPGLGRKTAVSAKIGKERNSSPATSPAPREGSSWPDPARIRAGIEDPAGTAFPIFQNWRISFFRRSARSGSRCLLFVSGNPNI